MSKELAYKIATYACAAYVAIILFSFLASIQLPNFHDFSPQQRSGCYWTNVMVGYVECGSDVLFHKWRRLFFNFWMMFVYFPLLGLTGWLEGFAIALAIYAPVVFLVYSLFRRANRIRNNK